MSDNEIKVGRLARDLPSAEIAFTRAADKRITLSFPASSEAPVDRWFGTEVLSHDASAVRMERLSAGAAPLLFNHDWNDPIGMIDAGRLADGRLYVETHLFDTARAAEVAAMVEGGLRNVSIGYEILQMTEDTKRNVFTATEWVPLEVSIVTVPADITVGVGRAGDDHAKPVRVVRAVQVSEPAAKAAAQPKESTVDVNANAAASANADSNTQQRMSALEAENQRREAVRNLCAANKIDARVEAGWIEDGTPLTVVAKEILDVQVERSKGKPNTAAALGLTSRETQRYSIFRAIRAARYGTPEAINAAAFEIECSREVAKKMGRDSVNILVPAEVLSRPVGADVAQRTMTTTPGSKGGYMVNVNEIGFVDILRNRAVCMNMGATIIPGLVGNAMFVRQTGTPSITWQAGETTSVTAADQTLGQLSMTPKTAIVITDVSEQLLRQATPSAEAFVMADLAKSTAIAVDSAAINGSGGAQPLGIKNTTGITSGQDAASVTWDKIRAFWTAAAGSNAVLGMPGWVTTSAGAALLMGKQRFTSTDTPIWEGNPMHGTMMGFHAMSSEQMASGNLIFGSWENLLIGEWGVLELSTDNGGTRFNNATVGIRAMWMVDTLLRYPQAFVVSVNLS